jgi:hypothetical protein
VKGLPGIEQVDQLCTGCLVGKQRRSPFPRQVEHRAESVLDLVHGDICGPITPMTPSGNRISYSWLMMLADTCGS